jgi:hypothetical protein
MDYRSKRKQDKIEPHQVRENQIKIMLNDEELQIVDGVRGAHRRAEAIRFLIIANLPAPVPKINISAWQNLARASGNLNQIAHNLNSGQSVEIEKVRELVEQFRAALIGAS